MVRWLAYCSWYLLMARPAHLFKPRWQFKRAGLREETDTQTLETHTHTQLAVYEWKKVKFCRHWREDETKIASMFIRDTREKQAFRTMLSVFTLLTIVSNRQSWTVCERERERKKGSSRVGVNSAQSQTAAANAKESAASERREERGESRALGLLNSSWLLFLPPHPKSHP